MAKAKVYDLDIAPPLPVFWSLLDDKAKRDILTVRLESLGALSMCKRCRELMRCAWHEADTSREHDDTARKAKSLLDIPSGFVLTRLSDGSYITEDTRLTYGARPVMHFSLVEEHWAYVGPLGLDIFRYIAPIVDEPARPCWYCHDKVYVRFVDMLTYPRPVRKFSMLLCRDDCVRALKQVLAAEVGLDGPDRLLLLLNGRRLDRDDATIHSLDLCRDDATIIVSKLPPNSGVALKPIAGMDGGSPCHLQPDRNKEFVGNLLLGFNATAGHDRHGSVPAHVSPPLNVRGPVASVERRHGYAMLGSALGQLMYERMVQAWQAEIKALQAQASLIAEEESEKQKVFLKARQKAAKAAARKERRNKPVSMERSSDFPTCSPDSGSSAAIHNDEVAGKDDRLQGCAKSVPVIAASLRKPGSHGKQIARRRGPQSTGTVRNPMPATRSHVPILGNVTHEAEDATTKSADTHLPVGHILPADCASAVEPTTSSTSQIPPIDLGEHRDCSVPSLAPELCCCARCGSSCAASSNFCSNCGFAVSTRPAFSTTPPPCIAPQTWTVPNMSTYAFPSAYEASRARPTAHQLPLNLPTSAVAVPYAPILTASDSWTAHAAFGVAPLSTESAERILSSPLSSLSLAAVGMPLAGYGHANVFAVGGYLDHTDSAASRASQEAPPGNNIFAVPAAHQPRRLPIFAELRSASSM